MCLTENIYYRFGAWQPAIANPAPGLLAQGSSVEPCSFFTHLYSSFGAKCHIGTPDRECIGSWRHTREGKPSIQVGEDRVGRWRSEHKRSHAGVHVAPYIVATQFIECVHSTLGWVCIYIQHDHIGLYVPHIHVMSETFTVGEGYG